MQSVIFPQRILIEISDLLTCDALQTGLSWGRTLYVVKTLEKLQQSIKPNRDRGGGEQEKYYFKKRACQKKTMAQKAEDESYRH